MKIDNPIAAGTRVRVEQVIRKGDQSWGRTIEGAVVSHEARKTGSWFAHGGDDKLWLNRLLVRKDDGEETLLTLDAQSLVTILQPGS